MLGTPEVARVYIGSFWDQPLRLARLCVIGNDDKILRFDVNRRLFEAEEQDLFADLQSLPRLVWNVWWRQRPLSDISKDLNSEHILKIHCQECSTEKTERPYQESAVSKGTKRRLFCDCFHSHLPHIRFTPTSSPVWRRTCQVCLERRRSRKNWSRVWMHCKFGSAQQMQSFNIHWRFNGSIVKFIETLHKMQIRNIFPWFSQKHDQQINELSWCHVKQIVRYSQQKIKTNCQVFTTATWAPDQPRRLPWHCKDARSLGETGQWTLWQCWHLMENLWRIYLTLVGENVKNLFPGNDGFH